MVKKKRGFLPPLLLKHHSPRIAFPFAIFSRIASQQAVKRFISSSVKLYSITFSIPFAPITAGTPQKIPFCPYSPSSGAEQGRILFSSRRIVRTSVAPAEAIPYSVHCLPAYVTQPPLIVLSSISFLSNRNFGSCSISDNGFP